MSESLQPQHKLLFIVDLEKILLGRLMIVANLYVGRYFKTSLISHRKMVCQCSQQYLIYQNDKSNLWCFGNQVITLVSG
jgi:hypothetical protein